MQPPPSRVPAHDARFDDVFVDALGEWLAALRKLASWRRLGQIPVEPLQAGRLRAIADRRRVKARGAEAFLVPSPLHASALAQLEREDPAAAFVYRIACLNETCGPKLARQQLGADFVARMLAHGVLTPTPDGLRATVAVAPFGDRAYLADARGPAPSGERAVYIGLTSLQELEYCRPRLPFGRRRRALEIGTGTGIVVLELRSHYDRWEGAEYDPRSVAFSRANARLCGADNVEFYPSDLFSGVTGRFDLILFNPWQPSEGSVDLIERFLLEAPDHLEDDARILLLLDCAAVQGRDLVLDRVRDALRRTGLSADRQILSAYRRGGAPASIGVSSALWIGRGVGPPGSMRTRADLGAARAAFRRAVLRATGR